MSGTSKGLGGDAVAANNGWKQNIRTHGFRCVSFVGMIFFVPM
jgi:hypothetical protein